ncbi:hypothetical protein GQ43DRAFT_57446 [Delitschia confertaspora ATCC 74209]|uniref:Transmembrane protein UsgS n=1 Tax=Delitschia confertaspora ATCC 74209 TaxID=1513339 RepID=A0A9P4JK35_9PLEO|nr:hypothetical protein GQ43DRAFT_57446 [Delitschia confertaspora ATCC 74209]
MSNFDLNAIIRGAQLTLVGANRALQNPNIFTTKHYRQAGYAVAAGIAIRVLVAIPGVGVKILLWFLSHVINMDTAKWDKDVLGFLSFMEHSVLQIPLFLMTCMRYITPTLDEMFMDSLRWVDQTYLQKHKSDDPDQLRAMYHHNLRLYSKNGPRSATKEPKKVVISLVIRYGRRAAISLAVLACSYIPYVGRFVLPAASFYTFHQAVGIQPAAIIFGSSILLPRRYLVTFLQSYFSSRSLMRELLEPYFSRIHYSKEQKAKWFKDRAGVLFGFSLAFFVMVKIPLVGVLVYGIAEASTAYLITKITEPPPEPIKLEEFKETSVRWKNKHDFLSLPLNLLDNLNVDQNEAKYQSDVRQTPRKMYL